VSGAQGVGARASNKFRVLPHGGGAPEGGPHELRSIQGGYRRRIENTQGELQVVPDRRSKDDAVSPALTSMSDLSVSVPQISPPQSLDDCMKSLQQIVPLLPAGASVFVIGITLPAVNGAMAGSSTPKLVDAADNPARSDALAPTESMGGQAVSESPVVQTPLEIVRAERRERPNRLRKTSEWAELLGMSARALRRAVDNGALAHEAKPDGRDHGATVIRSDVMEAFVALVEAVDRGTCDTPPWWQHVFGKKAWAHSA
jgi:hypothetical protein